MQKSVLTTKAAEKKRRGRPRVFDRNAALFQAMKLFWTKGFEPTSISDLTEAMGIGPTSLYAAFGSKNELYAEALALYSNTYEHLTLGRFRKAATAREAVLAYLQDSAVAMTGSDCDLPHGCMVNLGTVGSDGHEELANLMRGARALAFEVLSERLERAVKDGELPDDTDSEKLARFIQTVQSGMAIRARDGAEREELQTVAELAVAGWGAMVTSAMKR